MKWRSRWWAQWLLIVTVFIVAGCGANKAVNVNSEPSGARVFVGVEYVGDTPLDISLKEKGLLAPLEDIVVRAEKRGFSSKSQILQNNKIPNRLFFTLDTPPQASTKTFGGQQQEQQQQMQGPTIVITPGKAEVGGQKTQ